MKVYVVVSVCSGCVDEVKGFADKDQALTALAQKCTELGIFEGLEEESEHAAELWDIDVDVEVLPESVRVRRSVW